MSFTTGNERRGTKVISILDSVQDDLDYLREISHEFSNGKTLAELMANPRYKKLLDQILLLEDMKKERTSNTVRMSVEVGEMRMPYGENNIDMTIKELDLRVEVDPETNTITLHSNQEFEDITNGIEPEYETIDISISHSLFARMCKVGIDNQSSDVRVEKLKKLFGIDDE